MEKGKNFLERTIMEIKCYEKDKIENAKERII